MEYPSSNEMPSLSEWLQAIRMVAGVGLALCIAWVVCKYVVLLVFLLWACRTSDERTWAIEG